jgi:hypothetical protein
VLLQLLFTPGRRLGVHTDMKLEQEANLALPRSQPVLILLSSATTTHTQARAWARAQR